MKASKKTWRVKGNLIFETAPYVGLVGSVAGIFGPSISTFINNGSTIILSMYALKKNLKKEV